MQSAFSGLRARFRRILALTVAMSLAGAPHAVPAQYANLPRLGDAASEALAPALERRVGEHIVREMRRVRDLADDVEANAWLNAFAARLSQSGPAAGHTFELFLVNDRSLNAFALPGGFIGVHSGLIIAAQSESELASVIAHEIGHVTQRHIARMLAQQSQTSVVMLASLVLAALAATSNPQAAIGVASLGGTVARQQMLGFSRDAEREADRLGLDMLVDSGFDGNGMVGLLNRLQASNRLQESGAPDYLRSHPVTHERVADIQARLRETRYRQRVDSVEFRLLQARLSAQAQTDPTALERSAASFVRRLRDGAIDEAAGWYGLAVVRHAQKRDDDAHEAIAQARKRIGDHPYLASLEATIALDARDFDRAIRLADAAATQRRQAAAGSAAESGALARIKAKALIGRDEHRAAAAQLEQALERHGSDPELWRLLAEAWHGAGDEGRAHRASAEQFALLGGYPAAIDQLKRARQAGTLDFYTGSQVDARLRELERAYLQERQDRKDMGVR